MFLLGDSITDSLVGLGVFCGALIAIFTAVALIAKLPPVRWLWRQLVSGPLERFSTRIVRDGAAQFHTEVVAPQMQAIGSKVDDLIAQGETSWHKDKAWIVGRVSKIEVALAMVERRQGSLIQGVTEALNTPDVGAARVHLLDAIARAQLLAEPRASED